MTTSLALKILGAALLLALAGIIAAVLLDKTVPDILELLAVSALSAIAGVAPRALTAGSGGSDDPADGPGHRRP